MDFPDQSKLVLVICDGLDGNSSTRTDAASLENLALEFSSLPIRFIYLTSNAESNHLQTEQTAFKRHLRSGTFQCLQSETCQTFCSFIGDLNYKNLCYASFEGHVVVFIPVSLLNQIKTPTGQAFLQTLQRSIPRHIQALKSTHDAIATVLFSPSNDASLGPYILCESNDTNSGEILQWGRPSKGEPYPGSICTLEVEEMRRSKAEQFTVHQNVQFADVLILTGNAVIQEILTDGSGSMHDFVRNTIDSAILRPFPVVYAELERHEVVIDLEYRTTIADPLFELIDDGDDDDEGAENDAFKKEVGAFILEGLQVPENLKFKLMELKTFRLSSNRTNHDIWEAALDVLLDQIRFPNDTADDVANGDEDCRIQFSPQAFKEWFTKKNVHLIWDMYHEEKDEASQMTFFRASLHRCKRSKSDMPNPFGRLLKMWSDVVDVTCDNAIDLSGVTAFVEDIRSRDAEAKAIFDGVEFAKFLEWTEMEDDSDDEYESETDD